MSDCKATRRFVPEPPPEATSVKLIAELKVQMNKTRRIALGVSRLDPFESSDRKEPMKQTDRQRTTTRELATDLIRLVRPDLNPENPPKPVLARDPRIKMGSFAAVAVVAVIVVAGLMVWASEQAHRERKRLAANEFNQKVTENKKHGAAERNKINWSVAHQMPVYEENVNLQYDSENVSVQFAKPYQPAETEANDQPRTMIPQQSMTAVIGENR